MKVEWVVYPFSTKQINDAAVHMRRVAQDGAEKQSWKMPSRVMFYFDRKEIVGYFCTVWNETGLAACRVDVLTGHKTLRAYTQAGMIAQGEQVCAHLLTTYGVLRCSRSLTVVKSTA